MAKHLYVEYFKVLFLSCMIISYIVIFGILFDHKEKLQDLFNPIQSLLGIGIFCYIYLLIIRILKIKQLKKSDLKSQLLKF